VLLHGAPAGRIADVLRQDELYPHSDWLVPFFANHDVPRMASEPGGSPEKLLMAFALVLTLRGIPELYYGDEIGMTGGGDPENRHDFPGGWPGDARNVFSEEGRTPEQQRIFTAVQKLLSLRRKHPALRTGRLFHLFSDDQSYAFLRQTEDEQVMVVFNNGAKARTFATPQAGTPAEGVAHASRLYGEGSADATGKEIRIVAPAQSVSIFELQ
jgi:neopullulanase